MSRAAPSPNLCLVAEARDGTEYLAGIASALDATDAVTLVLTKHASRPFEPRAAKPLIELAQSRKIAALLVDDVAAASALGADGVHLTWTPDILDAYAKVRAELGANAIVGVEAGRSRHDAMMLGERGADYVAFGLEQASGDQQDAHEARLDLVTWWAEIFEIPVVAFDIETAREAAELARTGADFIAAVVPPDLGADGWRPWAAALVEAVHAPADAA